MGNLIFPVTGNSWRISSGYGPRKAPTAGASTFHRGVDIAAPAGTSVVAPTNLRITSAGDAGGSGNLVTGVDAQGNVYKFAHLNSINARVGDNINAGGMLGTVGSTGISTGSHLHYSVTDAKGNSINPQASLGGSSIIDKALSGLGSILSAPGDALDDTPVIGDIYGAFKGVTGMGGESWFEQFYNWINESQFFKRTAIIVLAIILIGIAFIALSQGTVKRTITEMAKKAV